MGHLVLADVSMTPTIDDVDRWVADAFDSSSTLTVVRTGALFPRAARPFVEHGFHEVDRLALLELRLQRTSRSRLRTAQRHSPSSVIRLRRHDVAVAAAIDASAFEPGWTNTAESLAEVARATPQSWRRLAVDNTNSHRVVDHRRDSFAQTLTPGRRGRQGVGFSITGRSGTTGYLQRLAVHPAHRRRGIARQLVDDAARWLTRNGATTMLVNTGVHNTPALELYAEFGFTRLDDELVVLDRHRNA